MAILASPNTIRIPVTVSAVLVALSASGYVGARLTDVPPWRLVLRVVVAVMVFRSSITSIAFAAGADGLGKDKLQHAFGRCADVEGRGVHDHPADNGGLWCAALENCWTPGGYEPRPSVSSATGAAQDGRFLQGRHRSSRHVARHLGFHSVR